MFKDLIFENIHYKLTSICIAEYVWSNKLYKIDTISKCWIKNYCLMNE